MTLIAERVCALIEQDFRLELGWLNLALIIHRCLDPTFGIGEDFGTFIDEQDERVSGTLEDLGLL